jgi:hypothetical protein
LSRQKFEKFSAWATLSAGCDVPSQQFIGPSIGAAQTRVTPDPGDAVRSEESGGLRDGNTD